MSAPYSIPLIRRRRRPDEEEPEIVRPRAVSMPLEMTESRGMEESAETIRTAPRAMPPQYSEDDLPYVPESPEAIARIPLASGPSAAPQPRPIQDFGGETDTAGLEGVQPARPHAKKGFWGRLAGIGKGMLQGASMGGFGGMIAGGITGGVDPQKIADYQYQHGTLPEFYRQQGMKEGAEDRELRRNERQERILDIRARREARAKPTDRLHGTRIDETTGELLGVYVRPDGNTYVAPMKNQAGETVKAGAPKATDKKRYRWETQANGQVVRVDQDTLERKEVPGVVRRVPEERDEPAGDATKRAEARVGAEYTGEHRSQMVKQRAEGLYSTYAQQEGITWETERDARDGDQEAIRRVGQVRARAEREAERIVRDDLDRLRDKYAGQRPVDAR